MEFTMPDLRKLWELRKFAAEIRLETLKEFQCLGFGHVGGSMSVVELLAALYGGQLRHDPARPDWEDRDRLVMSKGHAGPSLYASLALRGFFPLEMLKTLNKPGSCLPSHCNRSKTPGVDATTGSLGQGLSCGIGIALGGMLDEKDYYTYVVLGDGELNEGQNWEAVMFAAHRQLDKLVALVDCNGKQLDGTTEEILDLKDFPQKFRSFGWNTLEVTDGHDVGSIWDTIEQAKQATGRPTAIIARTIKGKGCTFSEYVDMNHHQFITPEQADDAVFDASNALSDIMSEEVGG